MNFSGRELRLFETEYLACAAEAKTQERRLHYLAMADAWNGFAIKQERDDSRCPDRSGRMNFPTRR